MSTWIAGTTCVSLSVLVLCDLCCRDLAIDLRTKLGDWFRVVQLLKSGGIGG